MAVIESPLRRLGGGPVGPAEPLAYFVAVEDMGVIAAWVAERLFPIGLHVTARGKDFLANRSPLSG